MSNYPHIASLKTAQSFSAHIKSLSIHLPFDEDLQNAPDSPLAKLYVLPDGTKIGNRFCVQPMEGWDGSREGLPSEFTFRRWRNFGRSGAKLVWGGEAVAVRHDGRASPNQLVIQSHTLKSLELLRTGLVQQHTDLYGDSSDLVVGLQLTHSGRFSRPDDYARLEPKILYRHPLLDSIYKLSDDIPVLTDMEIDEIAADFVRAARQARELGFDFVDIKHCHGYLGHELLSSYTRPGSYGGSFENRTRFLRQIVAGIRSDSPGLKIGVRLSLFDYLPFRPGEEGIGRPVEYKDSNGKYPFAFGGDPDNPLVMKLDEPFQFLALLEQLDIFMVNLTAGSPYYNPHLQRPAYYPPSDGYQLLEDPLVGVARLIDATAKAKAAFPRLAIVGTGYSYLQEWLPHVAQYVIRNQMADFVGLGRMMLSYPEMPADILSGKTLDQRRICRTFSDCTNAPRRGMVSGCYPLDIFYKSLPEAAELRVKKKAVTADPST